jgi:lipoate-protein ligase A
MGIAGIIMHQSIREEDLTPEEHLEREWQLFLRVETGSADYLFLVWEATRPIVVVGRNASVAEHIILDACHADGVRVVRRFSGGGAVVLGPGCVNYAMAWSLVSRPDLTDVAGSFRTILGQIAAALRVAGLSIGGGTDLVLNGRKVSGNAQRRGRRALIHHGTLLCNFDARLAARYLSEPHRQPGYRARRRHTEFIGNIPLSSGVVQSRLAAACNSFDSEMAFGGGV